MNTEQGNKQVREVKKKISKFNKRVEKDFGKWREENDVTCASLERNQKKRSHEAMESTSKQEHLESVVFNKEDAFPINPVGTMELVHDQLLVDITDYLKQEVRDAVPIFNALRLWILLRIPRMEDGNNFGVTIQKEFIKRLSDAQDQMEAIMDLLTQYYKKRGDAVTLVSIPSDSNVDDIRAFHCGLSTGGGGDRRVAVLLPSTFSANTSELLPVNIRRFHEEFGSAPESAFL